MTAKKLAAEEPIDVLGPRQPSGMVEPPDGWPAQAFASVFDAIANTPEDAARMKAWARARRAADSKKVD